MWEPVCTCVPSSLRTKKVTVPATVFSQVLGKGSCHLAAIRQATSTQIDVDKHSKQSPHRVLTVR